MVDRVKIYVKAGSGGSGCSSFKGVKFTRTRRADGGSGGKGADVIIRVEPNIQTLKYLQFKQQFRAENALPGQANKKKGANARPCIILVPPGTIVRELKNNLLLRDLTEPGEEFVVAKGGSGGRGNSKTEQALAGLPGEEKELLLELKLVADIGIIGYPNTGKSTFLAKVSRARPKIASFPFTTTTPILGTIEFSDFSEPASLRIVEIPALIKGASEGKGLGRQFLRHSERVKIFIHLIDLAAQEGRDTFADYQNLNQELKLYNPELLRKPQILAANKMDLPQAEINLRNFTAKVKQKVYPICALDGTGIETLLADIKELFSSIA